MYNTKPINLKLFVSWYISLCQGKIYFMITSIVLFDFGFFNIYNFLLGIFFIYISNAIPKVPYTLTFPRSSTHPLPLLGPGVSPVLGHIKGPRGLSSQ